MTKPMLTFTHIMKVSEQAATKTLSWRENPVGLEYTVTEISESDGILSVGETINGWGPYSLFEFVFKGWYSTAGETAIIVESLSFGEIYALGSATSLNAMVAGFPLQYSATSLNIATVPCYLAGTSIRTQRGEVAVEDLQQGDLLQTLTGDFAPLQWIGTRQVSERRAAAFPQNSLPIRFSAGSLGNGLPERDLWISPDHCLYHAGALIKAKTLVNGTTVAQMHPLRPITYYHLLLDRHEVIFAEGAASESYRPCGNVMSFANAGDFPADVEKNQPKSARRFPQKKSGPAVEALKEAIAAEAQLAEWRRAEVA